MAELLMTGGWAVPGSLAAYLRDTLPDHFLVVGDTTLWGQTFDAIVVGPDGLLVLDPVDQQDMTDQAHSGKPRDGGRKETGPATRKIQALQLFLRDEFPPLVSSVDYLQATREQYGDAVIWRAVEGGSASDETLSETIALREIPPDGVLADEDRRNSVGVALRDRRLTASQRASRPFVFRSGNLLTAGTKVWTIRAAIKHMDRHPADGIHHLCNDTLARWLSEEGAEHLATLAKTTVHQAGADRQNALETFLVRTGLVQRSPVVVLPKRLDLGYILSGERHAQAFFIRRGSSHTSGELEASEPWMRIEPRAFKSTPVEGVVSVDTNTLLIRPAPYEATIGVMPKETGERIEFPVGFRVVAAPSPVSTFLLRPLAGMALAAPMGAAIGMMLGVVGLPAPSWLASLAVPGLVHGWGVLIGLIWALLGALSGFAQPRAWPIHYAARRWLVRIAAWESGLLVVASAGVQCWAAGPLGSLLPPPSLLQAVLIGASLGIVPTVIDAVSARRHARDRTFVSGQRPSWRPILTASFGLVLLFGLLLAPRLLRPAWQRALSQGTLAEARSLVEDGWTNVNTQTDRLLNYYYLHYYDRRAPGRVNPEPAPSETGIGKLNVPSERSADGEMGAQNATQ